MIEIIGDVQNVRTMIELDFLDAAQTVTSVSGEKVLIVPDWRKYKSQGWEKYAMLTSFFYHELRACPLMYDEDRIRGISPYFSIRDDIVYTGIFNEDSRELTNEKMLCDKRCWSYGSIRNSVEDALLH